MPQQTLTITPEIVSKLNSVLDKGLVSGLGKPEPGKMCVEAAVCYSLGLPHGDNPWCVSPILRNLKINLNDKSWSSNKARAEGLRRLAIAQLGTNENFDTKFFIEELVCITLKLVKQHYKEPKWNLWADSYISGTDRTLKSANVAASAANAAAYTAYTASAANAAASAANAAANAAASAANVSASAANAAASAAYTAAYTAYTASAANAAASAAAYAANAANAANAATRDKILSQFAEDVVQILIKMKIPGSQWLSPIALTR